MHSSSHFPCSFHLSFVLTLSLLGASGCLGHDKDAMAVAPDSGMMDDAGEPMPDSGEPLSLGGLTVDTAYQEQEFDMFASSGHRFWFQVSAEQLLLINDRANDQPDEGDIYTPGAGSLATYADHVLVQDAASQSVADYGQVEVKLVGESTFRNWNRGKIPNLRFDTDEFEQDKRIAGFEHLRLNNSLVGSIFREHLAHEIYRALDYPALRSTYAFVGSNVWGDGVWIPMTLIEVYKRKFCKDNAALLGGDCTNMWEFPGDLGQGPGGPVFPGPIFEEKPIDAPLPGGGPADIPGPRPGDGGGDPTVPESYCQLSECDNTRLEEVMQVIATTPLGAGFKKALAPYIVWPRFHQFQCLSWVMWTGDDPIHGGNNNLIIERDDGKLIWAPYSVDISAGQEWYRDTPLTGSTAIAVGCQSDPACWAATISTCEDIVTRFKALKPESFVDDALAELQELGMVRDGDLERAMELREWFLWRQESLVPELERYRYLPDANGNCPDGLELCGDQGCGTAEQCKERLCGISQMFCDTLQRCIEPAWESCPSCEDDANPYFCELNYACVPDADSCTTACEEQGQEYCEVVQSCVPVGQCMLWF